MAGEANTIGTLLPLNGRPQVALPAVRLDGFRQLSANFPTERPLLPCQAIYCGPNEEFEGHERGNGVTGKTDERYASISAHCQGLTWPHIHSPKEQLTMFPDHVSD